MSFSTAKTSIPQGMKEFTQKVYERMPRVGLTALLVEVAYLDRLHTALHP